MTEEADYRSRMRSIREKLEAMDNEQDADAVLDLLEEAVEETERLGSELEGDK